MKKTIIMLSFLSLAAPAMGADLVGTGWFGPYSGECRVNKGNVSNVDGDVSFSVSATCDGVPVSGVLSQAEAFGDGASIRYFGKLDVNGRPSDAEAIVGLDRQSGKTTGAVAVGGLVFEVGQVWWD